MACTVIGLAITVICGQVERMGVIHADDLTHFLIAKWSWTWPRYLLNDWGRPGFTAMYFPAAFFGWRVCRVLSAGLTAATAWLTFDIASDLGVRAAWAVVPLFYLQPLVFKLSETTLTETPLMLYLALAIFLAQRHRWTASAAILSIGFVTRYEAILFLPVWVFAAWRRNIPLVRLWPILWAPLAVNLLAAAFGETTVFSRLLNPASSGQYGQGGWLTFFARSMEAFGPGIAVLAITGFMEQGFRDSGNREQGTGGFGLLMGCAAVYFGGQTALRALGLYDSGGYARFLVPISPIIAVAALVGWNSIWDRGEANRKRATGWIILAMLLLWVSMERQVALYGQGRDEIAELPQVHYAKMAVRIATITIGVLGTWAYVSPQARRLCHGRVLLPGALAAMIGLAAFQFCRPLQRPAEVDLIEETIGWLHAQGYAQRSILSANVWIDFLDHQSLPPDRPGVKDRLAAAPLGTLFAWEKQFAGSPDHHIALRDLSESPSFRLLHSTAPLAFHSAPYLYVFEKIGPWNTDKTDESKPARLHPTASPWRVAR